MDLVLAEWSPCPVGQRLLLAYLSTEDLLADMGKIAVFLLSIDGFEELASVDNIAELEDLPLLGWQAEA